MAINQQLTNLTEKQATKRAERLARRLDKATKRLWLPVTYVEHNTVRFVVWESDLNVFVEEVEKGLYRAQVTVKPEDRAAVPDRWLVTNTHKHPAEAVTATMRHVLSVYKQDFEVLQKWYHKQRGKQK